MGQLGLKDRELGILLEVRQAFRNVEAFEKGVEATQKTRVFREKDLDAEQKAQLQKLTERYCVVYQTLRNPPRFAVNLG